MQIPFRRRRPHPSVFTLISALIVSSTTAQAAPSQLAPVIGQEIISNQSNSLSGNLLFPNGDYADKYFIGLGIMGDINVAGDGTLLEASQEIIVENLGANSGAIGLTIGQATVGKIEGSISVTGAYAAHGLRLTGEDYIETGKGQGAYITEVSGDISVTTTRGSAVGIDVANGRIDSIVNASITLDATLPATREVPEDNEAILLNRSSSIGTIKDTIITATVSSDHNSAALNGVSIEDDATIGKIENLTIVATNNSKSASAVGISIDTTGSVGLTGGLNANMTINVYEGLAAFITTTNPNSVGTISGNYTMNVNNVQGGASLTSYSVGYLLGESLSSTTNSLGFSSNVAGQSNSAGLKVDWSNTTMNINRGYGYSTGVVVVGHQTELEKTVFGPKSEINTTIIEGIAVATWMTGMDLSEGALLGNLSATAQAGSAFGLAGTATDLVLSWVVDQSYNASAFGDISGNISATVEQEISGTKVVGVQLGNIFSANGTLQVIDSKIEGVFSGNISATLKNSVNTDGSLQSSVSGNVVAGIIDMGNQTLRFDGTTQGENDTYGTKVSAEIYHNNELRAYGDAVLTLTGGIKLSSEGKTTATAASFVGNLTAGMGASSSGTESLQFEKGNFQVTSEAWNAQKGITVGSSVSSSVGALYDTASVTLHDIEATVGETTTFNSNSLSFYANSMFDSSLIKTMEGVSLDLEGLTTVNIYLSGDDTMYGPLYFLDARLADFFDADNTGITYNLYFDGIEYEQSDTLKIVHDSTGIYLSSNVTIPEPSTATLSLLALAWLLSRRRRKRLKKQQD